MLKYTAISKAQWTSYFTDYDTVVGNINGYISLLDTTTSIIAAHWHNTLTTPTNNLQPFRVLDLGAGTGNLIHKLCEKYDTSSWEIVGIDMIDEAITIAKEKNKSHNTAQFFTGNICDPSFGIPDTLSKDKPFQIINLTNVWYTLSTPDRQRLISSLKDYLAQDGLIIVNDKTSPATYLDQMVITSHHFLSDPLNIVPNIRTLYNHFDKVKNVSDFNAAYLNERHCEFQSFTEQALTFETNGFHMTHSSRTYAGTTVLNTYQWRHAENLGNRSHPFKFLAGILP